MTILQAVERAVKLDPIAIGEITGCFRSWSTNFCVIMDNKDLTAEEKIKILKIIRVRIEENFPGSTTEMYAKIRKEGWLRNTKEKLEAAKKALTNLVYKC